MKKRCEICGKLYEPIDSGRGCHINIDIPVSPELREDGHYERRAHWELRHYDACNDCGKKVGNFIDNLIDGNTDEDKETDAPKKIGRWTLLYSPITNTTLVKCTECGFTIDENGRVNTFMEEECPHCKTKMEVYIRD